jgi:hypothetical protein
MDEPELVRLWNRYQEAIHEQPYDRDKVQGRGMAFADAWHAMCNFEYALKNVVMPAICTRVQPAEDPKAD